MAIMDVASAEALLFENGDWTVTPAGLEHKHNGYFIDREHLADRRGDGLWTWPLHMADKAWCVSATFAEAFMCALGLFGVKTDSALSASLSAVGRRDAETWAWGRAAEDLGLPSQAAEARALGDLAAVGVEVCRRKSAVQTLRSLRRRA